MKLGKLKVSDTFLQEENIKELHRLFNIFIPLHIEDRRFIDRCFIYTGYCERFDDIKKEMELPPFYDITFHENGNIDVVRQ